MGLIQCTSHSLEGWSEPEEGSSFRSVLALAYTPAVNLPKDPYLGCTVRVTFKILE